MQELLHQLSTNSLLGAVLTIVAAALGAFGGAHLRKRGENRAIVENFEAIREQLKITTRDTEDIKQTLFGHAWRTQQQWAAREQYYVKLLTHLYHFKLALEDLSEYFMEPGSGHLHDSERGERFKDLMSVASSSYSETKRMIGSAAVYLSPKAALSLDTLFKEHWHLANFDAMCSSDYVEGAQTLAAVAYTQILNEAKEQLSINSDA